MNLERQPVEQLELGTVAQPVSCRAQVCGLITPSPHRATFPTHPCGGCVHGRCAHTLARLPSGGKVAREALLSWAGTFPSSVLRRRCGGLLWGPCGGCRPAAAAWDAQPCIAAGTVCNGPRCRAWRRRGAPAAVQLTVATGTANTPQTTRAWQPRLRAALPAVSRAARRCCRPVPPAPAHAARILCKLTSRAPCSRRRPPQTP